MGKLTFCAQGRFLTFPAVKLKWGAEASLRWWMGWGGGQEPWGRLRHEALQQPHTCSPRSGAHLSQVLGFHHDALAEAKEEESAEYSVTFLAIPLF